MRPNSRAARSDFGSRTVEYWRAALYEELSALDADRLRKSVEQTVREDPERAFKIAELGLRLGELVFAAPREVSGFNARLLCLMSESRRRQGRLDEASLLVGRAEKLSEVSFEVQAAVLRARSFLSWQRGQAEQALISIRRAMEIEKSGVGWLKSRIGEAIFLGSSGRWKEAQAVLLDTMAKAGVGSDEWLTAAGNYGYVLSEVATSPEELRRARTVVQSLRLRLRGTRGGDARLKLWWIEGIILRRLGHWAKAVVKFAQAGRGLMKSGAFHDAALVLVEMVLLLDEKGESSTAVTTYLREMAAQVGPKAGPSGFALIAVVEKIAGSPVADIKEHLREFAKDAPPR